MSDITGVRTVGVPVTEQDRANEFPIRTLSVAKRLDAPSPQSGAWPVEVVCAGSSTSPADAAAPHGRLRSADVAVGQLPVWPGVLPMSGFRDLDDNGLDIVEAAA